MSTGMILLLIVIIMFGLMATGLPVAFALLGTTLIGYLVFSGPAAINAIAGIVFRSQTTDVYVAIPLFIFMASMLEASGLGDRLYDTMYKWFAGMRGGLAIGTVVVCTVLAATTGLASTGVLATGLLGYPEMTKRGYDKQLSIGVITAGGILGPIIPPSVPMIIVGGLTGLSVGKLFMAGVIPGLLIAVMFVAYVAFACHRNPRLGPPLPLDERATWKEKIVSLRQVILPVVLIVLVLGGIYGGVFTPSEAGGIGAAGAIACAALYRNLHIKNLTSAMLTTFKVSGMAMWIILGGVSFSSLIGTTGIAHFVNQAMVSLSLPPFALLIVMLLVLLVLGMFIETVALMMICIPVMMPIAISAGYDLLWFGFLFVLDVIIGMLTPPFGYNLFNFKGLGFEGVTMMDIYKSVLPYCYIVMFVLILCVLFPPIAMWLPNRMIR